MSTNDILLELSSGRQLMVLLQEQYVGKGCLNGSEHCAKKDILGPRPPPPKLRFSLSILNEILKKRAEIADLGQKKKEIDENSLVNYQTPFTHWTF